MVSTTPVVPTLSAAPSRNEQELRWYFTQAGNELASGSNFRAMAELMALGGDHPESVGSGPIDDERLDAVRRERRIRRALEAAGEFTEEVLASCLSDDAPPHLATFGVLAGLMPNLPEAHQAHRASKSRLPLESWLGRLPTESLHDPRAHVLLHTLLAEATQLLLSALEAYGEAKRRVGSGR